jgi:single-strand DNA-binding protein
MNRLTIIGNLVRDPELRTVGSGINVCTFTVAVNRRKKAEGQPEADFFRVSAWRGLAETCSKYLAKGRKVAVVGSVSAQAYMGSDGTAKASLELTADDVEFLSSRNESEGTSPAGTMTGFVEVGDDEPMPF